MRNRYGRISRDELRSIVRAKGWDAHRDGKFSKDKANDWLAQRGVTMEEVWTLVRQIRDAARGAGSRSPTTVVQQTVGMTEEQVKDLIVEQIKSGIPMNVAPSDPSMLKAWIAEAVAKAQPTKIVLSDPADKKPVVLKTRTHPLFEKVLKLVRSGLNVLLVGPAGCGKTTLAHQLSLALKRRYGTMHCTAGASESQLTGWLLPVGEGKAGTFTYVASEFVRLYEEGDSVFLLDELDAADPNVLLVINAALANGSLHIPQRHENPHVKRGKNVAIIAAANTFGTGADTMYAGRNQLDAATLDRFYVVRMDYDEALEEEIAAPLPESFRTWIKDLRRSVTTHRLRRVVSTRTFIKAAAAHAMGLPEEEIKADLLSGWSRDELSKVGVSL